MSCVVVSSCAQRLDHFMAQANAHYYATTHFWNDFVTAPEMSQVFGELLGAWVALVWQGMKCPSSFLFAEAGPGRGTLMADALRLITRCVPTMAKAQKVHLIETSSLLRERQRQALCSYVTPIWHECLTDLPEGPLILIGNEFLDALPIRQFIQKNAVWYERYVYKGMFQLVPSVAPVLPDGRALKSETVVELCEPAIAIAQWLGQRFTQMPGVALFIDYGHETLLTGDSLQALRQAQRVAPLEKAGEADLTAHVDFTAFAAAARQAGAAVYGTETQGIFLQRLGIVERTEQLAQRASFSLEEAQILRKSTHRMIASEEMGHLFKVIALVSPFLPAPPGFTENTT
ncbi:MAG: SAM-dependent methyltransferase [Acetobacter sp.]|nr:SAM-dependent methyltransferase [Acetobacter sp.]MBR2123581.1 SAM-dependent methyltransferase [Acetobacter sp.]